MQTLKNPSMSDYEFIRALVVSGRCSPSSVFVRVGSRSQAYIPLSRLPRVRLLSASVKRGLYEKL